MQSSCQQFQSEMKNLDDETRKQMTKEVIKYMKDHKMIDRKAESQVRRNITTIMKGGRVPGMKNNDFQNLLKMSLAESGNLNDFVKNESQLKATENKISQNKEINEEKKEVHFWKDQPSPSYEVDKNCVLIYDDEKMQNIINTTKCDLPNTYVWDKIERSDPDRIEDVVHFLEEHYDSTDNPIFKKKTSQNYFEWLLRNGECLVVRVRHNVKLVAVLHYQVTPNVHLHSASREMVVVDLVCVHTQLRSKRLLPVMIRKLRSELYAKNIKCGLFVSNKCVIKPLSIIQTFYRPLDYQKLIDMKMCHLPLNNDLETEIQKYSLPSNTNPNFEPLDSENMEPARTLLNSFNSFNQEFKLYSEFTLDDFSKTFSSDLKMTNPYVLWNDDHTQMLGFISFYESGKHFFKDSEYRIAELYYYACMSPEVFDSLIIYAMSMAQKEGYHIFSLKNISKNSDLISKYHFFPVTDKSYYELYNLDCPKTTNDQINLMF